MAVAGASSAAGSSGTPASALAAARPATMAALDEPSPDASGTGLCADSATSASGPPARTNAWATRFVASAGSVAAPSPSTATVSGPGRRSAVTVSRRGSATPRQS